MESKKAFYDKCHGLFWVNTDEHVVLTSEFALKYSSYHKVGVNLNTWSVK